MPGKKRIEQRMPRLPNTRELIVLEKKPPAKSLLFFSMSCEQKAAHIRSETADGLQKQDFMEIGYRYLQNKKGRLSTSFEIQVYSVAAAYMIINFCMNPGYLILPSVMFYIINILPNIGNNRCYNEVEKHCAKSLTDRFGEPAFREMEKLRYDEEGLKSLAAFMSRNGIDASAKRFRHIESMPFGFPGLFIPFLSPEYGTMIVIFIATMAIVEAFSPVRPSSQENATLPSIR